MGACSGSGAHLWFIYELRSYGVLSTWFTCSAAVGKRETRPKMAVVLSLSQGRTQNTILTNNAPTSAAQVNAGEATSWVAFVVTARRRYNAATVHADGLQHVGESPEPAVLVIDKITIGVSQMRKNGPISSEI